jgi:hypothetical protein
MEKGRAEVKEAKMGKEDTARAERMAQALRDNLRRRKAQSRAQGGEAPAAVPESVDQGISGLDRDSADR